MSIPQIDIPLSLQEAHLLGSNIKGLRHCLGRSCLPITLIRKSFESALSHFPDGAFVRLGSRSAKDSLYAQHYGLKVTNAYAAIKMLTQGSERVHFDLSLAISHQYQPHIFVRQWLEIPEWAEFRCFMKNRRLVGISQYDYKNLGHCLKVAANAKRIRSAIEEFFEEFRMVSHLDNVVFDVFILANEQWSASSMDVKLLELNPFFSKTDPCLFSWENGGDFDGSFRFL